MTDVLSRYGGTLGLPGDVAAVELLDARLTHPFGPGSPRCRGWATYLVATKGSDPVRLYVKGFPAGGASQATWQQDRVTRGPGRSAYLHDLDLVVWRFPEDPRLPALPDLVTPRLAARIMPPAVRDLLGSSPGDGLRTTVVRYQPEVSATLRLEVEGDGAPAVFAKHLADGTGPIASRHQALWSTSDLPPELRIAEPLAADPVRGVLWTRGVSGHPLAEAVDPDQLPDATASVGALLAALHASPVHVTEEVVVDDLLREAQSKAAKLARAHPVITSVVTDLVAATTRRRGDAVHERVCTLHGDFHLAQLVSSARGPVLVDLDSMTHGPPEVDLAEFLVELALRGLPERVTQAVARGLLSSYSSASGIEIDAALLETCADIEFLNRCYRHLRRHSPGWQSALETALGRHAGMRSLLRV
jgi:hypothetical protein